MVTRSQSTVAPRNPRQSRIQPKALVSTPSPSASKLKPTRTIKKTVSETPTAATGLKAPKPKKAKMVRDSFTMPKAEYMVLDELKQRAIALSYAAKKSELIRAGIQALAKMSDAEFLTATAAVPSIKTGRPAKTEIE